MSTATEARWISARRACARLGCGRKTLNKLTAAGRIGTLTLPEEPPKYDVADVARVASQAVRPARVECVA